MTEEAVYEHLARYIKHRYPALVPHFDLSGVHNPSPRTRALYSRLNGKAWPDLFIPYPVFIPGSIYTYHGLFIEIKRDGTRLQKRDGNWANEHIASQATMLAYLQSQGYVAQFGVGLDECIQLVDSYMEGFTPELQPEQEAEVF